MEKGWIKSVGWEEALDRRVRECPSEEVIAELEE